MSGIEIERMLQRIDVGIESSERTRDAEMLAYIEKHKAEIIEQLRARKDVLIPTSMGTVTVPASVLWAA